MTMTKAAIWLRVSTGEQHAANQLPDLQAWAERRGWEVTKVYEVQESAWKGAHLKALSEVYADAQRGYFNILLIWALDRLTREGIGPTLEIVNKFGKLGVPIYSFQETWLETTTAQLQDLLISVVGWVAQYESKRRSERTKAGMVIARAKGHLLGRPKGAKDKRQRRSASYFDRYRNPQPPTTK